MLKDAITRYSQNRAEPEPAVQPVQDAPHAGSKLQYNYDVDGSFRSSAMGTLEGMMNFWQTMEKYHRTEFFNGEMPT